MSREILVVTPENIEIEYELAGIGSRMMANMIDALYQILMMMGIVIVAVLAFIGLKLIRLAGLQLVLDALAGAGVALMLIAFFLVFWGYFIYFEIAWNGQTPGKRKLGLRVVRDGGYPVAGFGVMIRNLLRAIDGHPLTLLGGLLAASQSQGAAALICLSVPLTLTCLLASPRYQRLGDMVAGTMVVKQRAPRVPTLEALAPPPRVLPEHLAPYALADIRRHVYEMTVPEYRAVRHAIDRRWQLPIQMQQQAAMRLAHPLMQRLGIKPPPGVVRINYADLLEYLAVAFEQHRGVK